MEKGLLFNFYILNLPCCPGTRRLDISKEMFLCSLLNHLFLTKSCSSSPRCNASMQAKINGQPIQKSSEK